MARHSRFRSTSGPTNRPRPDKGKSFKKDDTSGDRKGKYSDSKKEDYPRKSPFRSFKGKSTGFQKRSGGDDKKGPDSRYAGKGKPSWQKDKPYGKPEFKRGGFQKRTRRDEDQNTPDSSSAGKGKPSWQRDKPYGKPEFKRGGFQKSTRRDEDQNTPDSGSAGKEKPNWQKRPYGKSEFNKGGDKPFKRKSWQDSKDAPAGKEGRKSGEWKPRYSKNEGSSFSRKRPGRGFSDDRKGKTEGGVNETPRDVVKSADDPSSGELIRLNKFISNSGVCSRREADDLIIAGLITVNGKSVTELGHKVKLTDDVRYEGKRLKAEQLVYILLNKPKGFITTTDDPQERNTVMQLIHGACKERVYPVGRLDRNTTGLLLLTNDGDLTDKLTHPSYNVKKIYKAELDRPLTKADFQKILEGVRLEEGKAQVDDLALVSDDGKTVGLELHIGWNRIVRRIFEALGYAVEKLDRTVYATLDKKELPRGHWRFLRQDEIIRLKHFQ